MSDFRTSDPQRNVMGQSAEKSPFVSTLFQNILVLLIITYTQVHMCL